MEEDLLKCLLIIPGYRSGRMKILLSYTLSEFIHTLINNMSRQMGCLMRSINIERRLQGHLLMCVDLEKYNKLNDKVDLEKCNKLNDKEDLEKCNKLNDREDLENYNKQLETIFKKVLKEQKKCDVLITCKNLTFDILRLVLIFL